MDESLRLMKTLWKEDVVNFEGDFFHVEDALFLPKPTGGDIPVWIGGNGQTARRRAATLGDGWHPVGVDASEYAKGAEEIRGSGRDVTLSLRMTTDVRKKRGGHSGPNKEKRVAVSGSAAEVRKEIEGYAQAGLEYYCASINHPAASDIIKDLKEFSSEVIRSYG